MVVIMVDYVFDGGLDLAEMMTIDLLLEGLHDAPRDEFISYMKTEEFENWNAYVDQKKRMGVIVEE